MPLQKVAQPLEGEKAEYGLNERTSAHAMERGNWQAIKAETLYLDTVGQPEVLGLSWIQKLPSEWPGCGDNQIKRFSRGTHYGCINTVWAGSSSGSGYRTSQNAEAGTPRDRNN